VPEVSELYSADQPLRDPADDLFNRWPFAQGVAQALISRRETNSLVVALYGAWGEGKTTVLNFVETALANEPSVVCVRFNPWRFSDQATLLQSFFETLATAADKSLVKGKEKIGKWLKQYGTLLTPVSGVAGIALGLAGLPSPGDAAAKIGESLAAVDLEELKRRIDDALQQSEKRLVVFIDDIDRLDKGEIHLLFKLVKVSADFQNVSYLLAFDRQMVASALAERYGGPDAEAGSAFLEKIVQVPLDLPPADPVSLRQLCFSGVDLAVKESGLELDEDQVQDFVLNFVDAFQSRLTTGRMAKRYSNSLAFALPILKSEVNIVDQMLVEALRIFYADLYGVVRRNREIFTGTGLSFFGRDRKERDKRVTAVVANGIDSLDEDEKKAARSVLKRLFPAVSGALGGSTYGPDWHDRWAQEQRVVSSYYFERYFSYGIPKGDFADSKVSELLSSAEHESGEALNENLKHLVTTRNADSLVVKLRRRAGELSPRASCALAEGVSRAATAFPDNKAVLMSSPFDQAGMLMRSLVANVPDQQRQHLAESIIHCADAAQFAVEAFRWLRTLKGSTGEENRILSDAAETAVGRLVVHRIEQAAAEGPLFASGVNRGIELLDVWAHLSGREPTDTYIKKALGARPELAVELLRAAAGKATSLESGRTFRADLERDGYDRVARIVDPAAVLEILQGVYGASLEASESEPSEDATDELGLARQFAQIHAYVRREQSRASTVDHTDESAPRMPRKRKASTADKYARSRPRSSKIPTNEPSGEHVQP
jgi:uncharacterized protein YceH (UPF0502 family)